MENGPKGQSACIAYVNLRSDLGPTLFPCKEQFFTSARVQGSLNNLVTGFNFPPGRPNGSEVQVDH